ncbi:MAG: hypothetical protein CMB80_31150 [Flammeovirgaceae bacterium]|nr:hypothetical protein [Flammeovirgaceae bacterium]|tara:strand:- start:925 stop:1161 length:237 start_codon:yes stop_codon:yes gene_type:complete
MSIQVFWRVDVQTIARDIRDKQFGEEFTHNDCWYRVMDADDSRDGVLALPIDKPEAPPKIVDLFSDVLVLLRTNNEAY